MERLRWIRELGLDPQVTSRVHQNRLQQLAREGARMTAPRLGEFDVARRDATLVAFLLATAEDLVDQACGLPANLSPLDRIWVKKNLDKIWVNFITLSRFREELKSAFCRRPLLLCQTRSKRASPRHTQATKLSQPRRKRHQLQ